MKESMGCANSPVGEVKQLAHITKNETEAQCG